MTYLIALAALALVPMLVILLLRVNAAIAFMSLCLGSVLVRYTSSDVTSIASGLSSRPSKGFEQWVDLGLLLVPFVVTIMFTRKSVGGGKKFINVLPALATGLLTALLVVPLLSSGLQSHLEHQQAWRLFDNLQTAVILGGAFFSLVFLLLSHRGGHGEEKKHGKH